MLAADNWCVKVEERVYGPYTSQQLRKFAHEGRFAPGSLVAPAGSLSWREARSETVFAPFFGEEAPRNTPSNIKAFGKRDLATSPKNEPKHAFNDDDGPGQDNFTQFARREPRPSQSNPQVANFILIFDIVSAAASRVETAVLSLGPAFRLAPNIWTLSCELSAVGVRNAIAPYLLPRESIFVVDATRGRASWQNFTPELHAKLAAAWASTRT
jgi:hypothetical protein